MRPRALSKSGDRLPCIPSRIVPHLTPSPPRPPQAPVPARGTSVPLARPPSLGVGVPHIVHYLTLHTSIVQHKVLTNYSPDQQPSPEAPTNPRVPDTAFPSQQKRVNSPPSLLLLFLFPPGPKANGRLFLFALFRLRHRQPSLFTVLDALCDSATESSLASRRFRRNIACSTQIPCLAGLTLLRSPSLPALSRTLYCLGWPCNDAAVHQIHSSQAPFYHLVSQSSSASVGPPSSYCCCLGGVQRCPCLCGERTSACPAHCSRH